MKLKQHIRKLPAEAPGVAMFEIDRIMEVLVREVAQHREAVATAMLASSLSPETWGIREWYSTEGGVVRYWCEPVLLSRLVVS